MLILVYAASQAVPARVQSWRATVAAILPLALTAVVCER